MRRLAVTLFLLCVAGVAQAQDASPTIKVFHAGANQLIQEVEYLLGLTNSAEQAQWDRNILPNIEIFLDGIDRTKPMRIDLILTEEGYRYQPNFPIADQNEFLRGIKLNGIQYRRRVQDYYQLSDAFTGYLRFKNGYASIAEVASDVPPTLPDPRAAIANLTPPYTAGVDVENTAAGQQERREAFESLRKEVLATMKPMKDESANEYARRSLLFEHQLNEVQRLFVEARKATVGWTMDAQAGRGRLELLLAALPDTALAASVNSLATTPSLFGGVPRPEAPILSGRIVFPLDEMRQKHIDEFYQLVQPQMLARIDADQELNEDGKAAARDVTGRVFAMLDAGRTAGLLDGFVDVAPSGSGNTLVGGVRAVNGTDASAILELLPRIKSDLTVQMNAETVGDVPVHIVTLPAKFQERLFGFFGSEGQLLVATAPQAVWFAMGENALPGLRAAIEAGAGTAEEGKVAPVVVELLVKFAPWLELRQQRAQPGSGDPVRRQRAIEAFAGGEGQLSLRLERIADGVAGVMLVDRGVLRMVGKEVSAFAKENLE